MIKDRKPDYSWIKEMEPIHAIIDPEAETKRELPVLDEPKSMTMDKKVILEAATTGWQPTWWWRDRGEEVLPPGSRGGETCVQEQVDSIIECVKAGAAGIHTHPRRASDGLPVLHEAKLTAEIYDRAFDEVDFVTFGHAFTWDLRKGEAVDFVGPAEEFLELGKGNKYLQSALIPSYGSHEEGRFLYTEEAMIEGVTFYEENDIKPICSIEPYFFPQFKRMIFDTGLAKKPFLIALQMGKHGDDQQFCDPWSYLQMITNMGLVRSAISDEDMTLGLHPGGRNWLAVTVVALLNGIQYIRLGIEDIFFLWPHKDDIAHKTSKTIEMIKNICEQLGRELATPEEAREIMGIKYTS